MTVLANEKRKIRRQNFDADEMISLVGIGHDWKNLLPKFRERNISKEFFFDASILLMDNVAVRYIDENAIGEEEYNYISRLKHWSLPALDNILSSNTDFEKIKNITKCRNYFSFNLDDFFRNLDSDGEKLFLNNSEFFEDKENFLLELINSNLNFDSIIESMDFEGKLEYGLDPATESFYQLLKKEYPFSDDEIIKDIALSQIVMPESIDFCLQNNVAAEEISAVAKAYDASPDLTKKYLGEFDSFSLSNIANMIKLSKKFPESEIAYIKENSFLDGLSKTFSRYNTDYRLRFKKYFESVSLESRKAILDEICKENSFSNFEFALKNNFLGYKSSTSVIQLSKPQTIIEKSKEVIDRCYEMTGRVIVKGIKDKNLRKYLQTNLRKKTVSVKDLHDHRKDVGKELIFKYDNLLNGIKGICESNIEKICNQLNINQDDLKKIISKVKVNDSYNPEDIEECINDFVSNQTANESDFPVKKLVEAEFKAFSHNRRSDYMGLKSNRCIIFGMYPNSHVLESLIEDDIYLSEHYQNTLAYIRCYVEDMTLKVEEIQSDIFDKNKKIPSSIKNKYKNWGNMILMAFEKFAFQAGYKKIQITTSELQSRKWKQYTGIHGVTSCDVYTDLPILMGYRLRKVPIEVSEDTGSGTDLAHSIFVKTGNQSYSVAWSKNLKKDEVDKYPIFQSESERQVFEELKKLKVIDPDSKAYTNWTKKQDFAGQRIIY